MTYLFSNIRGLKEAIMDKLNVLLGGGELIPELSAEQLWDRVFEPVISEYGRLEHITQKIIEEKFEAIVTAVNENETAIGLNLTAIEAVTTAVTANAVAVGLVDAAVDLVKGVADNIKSKTDNLDASMSSLKTQVDLITTAVDSNATAVGLVDAAVDLVKGVADNIKTKTDNLDASMSSLKTQVDLITTAVDLVKGVSDTINTATEETEKLMRIKEESRRGLVLYLPMDEGSGAICYDRSDYSHDGTITDATWKPDGLFGSGLKFTFGTAGYVEIADAVTLQPDKEFTIIQWFRWDGTRGAGGDDHACLFSKGTYGSGEISILMNRDVGGSTVNFRIFINNAERVSWETVGDLDTDEHQLAVVYDGVNIHVMFDGILKASSAYSTAISDTANVIRIGTQSDNTYSWAGTIAETRYYMRALLEAQVKTQFDYGSVIRARERIADFITQLELKETIDLVKTKTDNLDASISSLKTQVDAVTTAVGQVKTGTDKIIASGATEAKQDTVISGQGYGLAVTPGDTILHSNDASSGHSSSTYTKVKEIMMGATGLFRVHFKIAVAGGSGDAWGKIYKDGVAYGTERADVGNIWEGDEDLAFEVGDLCQLYTKVASPREVLATNFQLRGTAIKSVGANTIVSI